jgi:hypothetical protein
MLFYFEISNLNMLCCLYCWLMKFLGVLDYLCFRYPRVWIWCWIITQTDFRVGFRFRFGLWIMGLVPWHYILSEFNPLPSSNSHDMTHNKFLLFIFHIFFFRFASCFFSGWPVERRDVTAVWTVKKAGRHQMANVPNTQKGTTKLSTPTISGLIKFN